jgi:hypothetical protein
LRAYSPDLNIIENVWKVLKISVQWCINEIRNSNDLKQVVQDIWEWPPFVIYAQFVCKLARANSVCIMSQGSHVQVLKSWSEIHLILFTKFFKLFDYTECTRWRRPFCELIHGNLLYIKIVKQNISNSAKVFFRH